MPNNVTTILTAPMEVLDYLRPDEPKKDWQGHDIVVDFNRVIPMPSYDDPMFTAPKTDFGDMVGWGFGGYSPLDWARENWGTKWNAYDTERKGRNIMRFDTAWNHPAPVIEALSRKFPDAPIYVQYADEDLGSNLGEYTIRNSEIIESKEFESLSNEALDFAAHVKYNQTYADYMKEWGYEDE